MTVLTAPRNAAFSRQLVLPFGPATNAIKPDPIKALRRAAPPRPAAKAPPGWLCVAARVVTPGNAEGATVRG